MRPILSAGYPPFPCKRVARRSHRPHHRRHSRWKFQGNISTFEGIPFAAPPVGNLRWREPQPPASWSGIRDATHRAHACTQSAGGVDNFLAPLADAYESPLKTQPHLSSEDCLYLNVFSPWPVNPQALPVMVWLHGGSNRVGTGSDESYNGGSLASHGVIVVTINYRLGVIGFFAHPQLAAESLHLRQRWSARPTGRLALGSEKHRSIRGDPQNVTLFVVPPPQPQSNRQSPPQKLLLQTRLRNSPTSLILCIESYWTNFAKSGNPNAPSLPTWKPWDSAQEPYLEFTQSGTAVPQRNSSPPFCHLAVRDWQQRLAI